MRYFFSSNPSLVRNYEAARYGVEKISNKYPYGGLNRQDTALALDKEEFNQQVNLLNYFRRACSLGMFEEATKLFFKLKGFFCRELSHLAKFEIENKFKDLKVEIVSLGYHCLLVIGREEKSEPNNIETWGKNSVICDPWARKVYHASEFWNVRYNGEDIEYLAKSNTTGELVLIPDRKHYLDGEPKISSTEQTYCDEIRILSFK